MKSIRARTAVAAFALCFGAIAADAQSKNVQVLSMFAPEGRVTSTFPNFLYNDLWGYVSPTGGEYVVMGSRRGTYIVDARNATQPTQVAFFASSAGNSGWSDSWWRDMKTFGTYAYVVTEGGGGMQIIDLTNPQSPQMVKTWGRNVWSSKAHNIAMDTDAGVAYPCGTRGGIFAIDVKTDPINPSVLGQFRTPYVHDLHVQHGFGYFSDQNNNRMLILDVRSLPAFTTLGRAILPGSRISHNCWASEDDDYAVTTNEIQNEPLGIFDIRTKSSPQLVSTFKVGSSSELAHNAYIKDGIIHVAYYTQGYRAIDISDPANPVEVGFHDTWSGASSSYNGAWACCPFQPSGVVYINDMQSGLFILKPKATAKRYGAATAGTGGKAPVIRHWGAAWLGNASYRLKIADGAPNALAYFVVGFGSANANVAGLTLNVNFFSPPAAFIPVTTDAQGKASLGLGVPNVAALDGTQIYVQGFVTDANGPLGFSATRGMQFELFQR